MKSVQQEFASTQVIEGGLSVDRLHDQDIVDVRSFEQMQTAKDVTAPVIEDTIALQEARIIECRKRRDELFMAVCKGTATSEQEAEYRLACSDVHDAQVAYGVELLGTLACKKNQASVA